MSAVPLPNFFIAGAGKAGTTSLYHYLRQHPEIYMSPVKEPCYFAPEIRAGAMDDATQRHVALQSKSLPEVLGDGGAVKAHGWIAAEWEDYLRLFQGVTGEKAVGEASAAYLWSETAAANIRARVPEAKILLILRDPAERAFSQYLHQVSVGMTGASFREHLTRCREHSGAPCVSATFPFLEAGSYSAQVERFLASFPREQLRIYWYEEAWRNPGELLGDAFRFLEVDASFEVDFSHRDHERRAPRMRGLHRGLKRSGLWYPLKALVPRRVVGWLRGAAFRKGKQVTMEAADRRYLVDYYREDIRRLEGLMGRDLAAWLR
ncbi:MAG: sulfotransferase [Candidatus Solibacter sp.]